MSGRLWHLQLPGRPVRGAYVSLGTDWPALVAERGYSAEAASLLGQMLVAMPLLTAHLKTRARVSLQISQAGALKLLTVQGSVDGRLRGMVKLDGELPDPAALQGQLVVTLEPEQGGQMFQGIVALEGSGPAQWLAQYFEQSEQVPTRLLLCADQGRAGGLLLQAMPDARDDDRDWMRAVEALDADFLPEAPGEWLSTMLGFDLGMSEQSREVVLTCSCSLATVSGMLFNMGRGELEGILAEQGEVELECGFCGRQYHFDADAVAQLFAAGEAPQSTN